MCLSQTLELKSHYYETAKVSGGVLGGRWELCGHHIIFFFLRSYTYSHVILYGHNLVVLSLSDPLIYLFIFYC